MPEFYFNSKFNYDSWKCHEIDIEIDIDIYTDRYMY